MLSLSLSMDDILNPNCYYIYAKTYTNSLDVLDHCFEENPDKELIKYSVYVSLASLMFLW